MAPPAFITVGSVRMSLQAFITILGGAVLSVATLVMGIFFKKPSMIFTSILTMGMFFYLGYVVNCTVVGKCTALSWFLVAMYLLWVLVAVGGGMSAGAAASKIMKMSPMKRA